MSGTPLAGKRRRASSSTSRRFTTASAGTPPWGICLRRNSSARTTRNTLNLGSIFLGEDHLNSWNPRTLPFSHHTHMDNVVLRSRQILNLEPAPQKSHRVTIVGVLWVRFLRWIDKVPANDAAKRI